MKVEYRLFGLGELYRDAYEKKNDVEHPFLSYGKIGNKENSFKSPEEAMQAAKDSGMQGYFFAIPFFKL